MTLASTLERGGSAGYIALLLVVLIGVSTVFLIRNMSSRLKKLPPDFERPEPTEDDRPGGAQG